MIAAGVLRPVKSAPFDPDPFCNNINVLNVPPAE
jgi:hypothetical protein